MRQLQNRLSLEDMLENLCSYGKPKVSMMSEGWLASIEMHVSSKGTTFNIRSEFNHTTPTEAVIVLVDRVDKALRDLNG